MCRYLLAKQTNVIATCRDPTRAQELSRLKDEHGDLIAIHCLDVQDEKQIEEVAAHVGGAKLDLLVNCAGMLHPSGKGETSLREVRSGEFKIHVSYECFRTFDDGKTLRSKSHDKRQIEQKRSCGHSCQHISKGWINH